MAIPATNFTSFADRVEITVPLATDPAGYLEVGAAFEPGDKALFTVPEGTAANTLQFLSTSFGERDGLSTSNPITVQFQGVEISATVPAALLSRIQVPDAGTGTGIASPGDGSVIFEAVSPFFTPGDLTETIEYWVSESQYWNDAGAEPVWEGVLGNYSWENEGSSVPSFDNVGSTILCENVFFRLKDSGGSNIFWGNTVNPVRFIVTIFAETTSTNGMTCVGSTRGSAGFMNSGGQAFNSIRFYQGSGNGTNFNGNLASGDVEYINGDLNYDHGGTPLTIPSGTPFIMSHRVTPGGNDLTGTNNSASLDRLGQNDLDAKLVAMVACSTVPSEENIKKILRWGAVVQLAQNRGLANPLVAGFPERTVIPLVSSGGASSGISVGAPPTIAQIENIIPGSKVLVERVSDGLNLIDEQIILTSSISQPASSTFVQAAPFDVRIVVRNSSGNPRYKRYEAIDTFRSTGLTHRVNQVLETLP